MTKRITRKFYGGKKNAKNITLKAELAAKKAAEKAELVAKKAADKAELAAKKAAEKAELATKKAAEKAELATKKAAEKAELVAKKAELAAKKAADKAELVAKKAADKAELAAKKTTQKAVKKVAEKQKPKTHYMVHLERLKHYNKELFDFKATNTQYTYSRACQTTAGRQPNVLTKEELDLVVKLYGDKVEWLFLPPPHDTILDVEKLSIHELTDEFKKRGLQNEILDERGKSKITKREMVKKLIHILSEMPGPQGAITRLIYYRHEYKNKEKPIWVVAKAGSSETKNNYYICAHYWCIRDNIPLIPSEIANNGDKCPHCNGKIISDLKHYDEEETVIKRPGRPGGSHEVQDLVGYLEITHPDNLALPCCYVMLKPEQIIPKDDMRIL